jgi:hypothetical protein
MAATFLKEDVTFDKSIFISNKDGNSASPNGTIGQLRFNYTTYKFEGFHVPANSNTGADIFGNKWRSLTQDVASASALGIIKVGTNLNINPTTGVLSSVATGVSRIYQLIITVSPIIGAADYQSINEAISNAIGTPQNNYLDGSITSILGSAPSPHYPFIIILSPGKYSESSNTIVLPDYVSLIGEDNYNSTIIQNTGNTTISTGSMIITGQNTEIKNLVIHLADSQNSAISNAIYCLNKSNVVIDSCIINCSSNISTTELTYGIYMDGGNKNQIINNKINFNTSTLLGHLIGIYIENTILDLVNNSIDILSPRTAFTIGIFLNKCISTDSIFDKLYIENLKLSINYYNTLSYNNMNTGINIIYSNLVLKNSYLEVSNNPDLSINYGIKMNVSFDTPTQPYYSQITSNIVSFINTDNSNSTINSSNISVLNFLTVNYERGQYISVSGSSDNDGIYKISSIPTSNIIVLENGYNLINETVSSANTITLQGLYDINISNSKISGSSNSIKNSDNTNNSNYIVNLNNIVNEGGPYIITPSYVYYTNYKTITVGKANCDYNSLYNAMNSITDSSSNTRYLIKIQSGIYYESTYIECKEYVDIEGNGNNNTIINFSQADNVGSLPGSDGSCLVLSSSYISIKNLTINNTNNTNNILNQCSTVLSITQCSNLLFENIIINNYNNNEYIYGIYCNTANNIKLLNVEINVNSNYNSATISKGIWIRESSNWSLYNTYILVNTNNCTENYVLYIENSECNIYNPTLIANSGQNVNACVYTFNNTNTLKLIQIYNGQIRAYNNAEYSIYADNYYTIVCNGVQLLGDTFANSIVSTIYCNSCYTFMDETDITNIKSLNSRGQNEQNQLTITLGDTAGKRNATGYDNVFIGVDSGSNVSTDYNNTFVGSNTGRVLSSTNNNTLIGANTGSNITNGSYNTITGAIAGTNMTTGSYNTITGESAGYYMTTSENNTIFGYRSAYKLVSGNNNTFMGNLSGFSTTTGSNNTSIGNSSGYRNTIGNNNTYLGKFTGHRNVIGNYNVLLGNESGYTNTTDNIVAVGSKSGYNNKLSIKNTYIGYQSGYNNNTGVCNTYLGHYSGYSNTDASGSYNIFIGNEAGSSITSGSRNILIGSTKDSSGSSNDAAGWSLKDGTDNIYIGANSGALSNSCINNVLIGSDVGTSLTIAGNNVLIGKNTGNSINNNGGNIVIGSESGNDNTYGNALIIGQTAGSGYTGNLAYSIGNNSGKNIQGDYNMFIGNYAGSSNRISKTGSYNLAIGPYSGNNLTTGSRNVLVGSGDSISSVGSLISYGSDNTLLGFKSGSAIQSGNSNTLIGSNSGAHLTSGANNLVLGHNSAYNLSTGDNNVSLGPEAGYNLSLGSGNIFSGYQSGYNTTSGFYNINIGYQTGFLGTTSINNIHIGYKTGYKSSASNNLFLGYQAGYQNTTGANNIFIGLNSGSGNNSNNRQLGDSNVFIGTNTGFKNDNGQYNIFMGLNAGKNNTDGSKNIFIGGNTGLNSIISRNIFIGTSTDNTKGIGYNSNQDQYNSNIVGDKNLFIGHDVGIENLTGSGNIFLGDSSGQKNTTGVQNIYIGTSAGKQANTDTANYNIAIGYNAGKENINGQENILIGKEAGKFLNESNQIFIGTNAGSLTTTGNNNIFIGYSAGSSITTQARNVVIGYNAMNSGVSNNCVVIGNEAGSINNGDDNIFIGNLSGILNNTGNANTFIGSASGAHNDSGRGNIFMGRAAGVFNSQGHNNTFMGYESGYNNINGEENIFIGYQSGVINQYGTDNIFMGALSGSYNQSNYNTFIGYSSGYFNLFGTKNTFIGYKTGYNNSNNDANYNTYIGNLVGQLNNGSNNFFMGFEELDNSGDTLSITNYNNKFAIYNNTQSGITDSTSGTCNILIGGDFSSGTVGIGTLIPDTYVSPLPAGVKLVVVGSVRANSYLPFTGSHEVNFDSSITNMNTTTTTPTYLKEGMIMTSTGIVEYQDINNTVVTVIPSIKINDKAVYGVYSGNATFIDENNISKTIYYVNSLGEGGILVSNFGGEIQNGDYITTCPIDNGGYGALQNDDIMHSYTVAKCTQNIDWTDITLPTINYNGVDYKYCIVSCTYHCG